MDELLFGDASGEAEAIRAGEMSASELVRAYLDSIEPFDPVVVPFSL